MHSMTFKFLFGKKTSRRKGRKGVELGCFPKWLWDWAAWDLASAQSEVNLSGMQKRTAKRDDSLSNQQGSTEQHESTGISPSSVTLKDNSQEKQISIFHTIKQSVISKIA